MVEAAPAKPAIDPYPKVIDHYGEPSYIVGRLGNEPAVFNGVVNVERYQIRIERIDEPDDVVIARLKRVWRTQRRNYHDGDVVRSYAMKKFGWSYGKAIAEFSGEDQGCEYVERLR